MKKKHTKGEWKHFVSGDRHYVSTSGSFNNLIAEVYAPEDTQEDEANARLISSAPDLLEALSKLYNTIDSCVDLTPELLQECKKAINKATVQI